jgi:hypothetical protein
MKSYRRQTDKTEQGKKPLSLGEIIETMEEESLNDSVADCGSYNENDDLLHVMCLRRSGGIGGENVPNAAR